MTAIDYNLTLTDLSAGGGYGPPDLIVNADPTPAAETVINVASLDAGDLEITYKIRSTGTAGGYVRFRFNDTGLYFWARNETTNSGTNNGAGQGTGASYMEADRIIDNTFGAGIFTRGTLRIQDYKSAIYHSVSGRGYGYTNMVYGGRRNNSPEEIATIHFGLNAAGDVDADSVFHVRVLPRA